MIADDLAYEGFASPQTGLNPAMLEAVVVNHGMQTLDAFIQRSGAHINRKGSGLVAALKMWLESGLPYLAVWNFVFGDMYATLFSNQLAEVERSAVALALRAVAFDVEAKWQFELASPFSFLFDRWVLPFGDAIRMSARDASATIEVRTADGWRQTVFHREANGWKSDGAESLAIFTHTNVHFAIFPLERLPTASPAQRLVKNLYDDGVANRTDLLLKTCREATNLIGEFAGIYLPWVSEVIKELIPLPPRPNVLHSASGNLAPGMISVTNQPLRCALAEQLVHEATHQHLYILRRLGSLDDGTDATLHFSPFRKEGRPLFFILFAYHAFANVLLFYRMARAHGLPADELGTSDERKLEDDLRTVEKVLTTSKALTPLGKALWQPLYELLRQ
jgi:HEXXH motif-containing protein